MKLTALEGPGQSVLYVPVRCVGAGTATDRHIACNRCGAMSPISVEPPTDPEVTATIQPAVCYRCGLSFTIRAQWHSFTESDTNVTWFALSKLDVFAPAS